MANARIMEKAFQSASAVGTFFGYDADIRRTIAENGMRAYLDNRHIEASDADIHEMAETRLHELSKMETSMVIW